VADSTCDEAQGRDVSFACFHDNLAAQNEQPLINPQVLFEPEDIPGGIVLGIGEREKSHQWLGIYGFPILWNSPDFLVLTSIRPLFTHRLSGLMRRRKFDLRLFNR